MIKDKIIGYCNSLGLDTLGFIPCRRFEELVEFYKYRKENNLENELSELILQRTIKPGDDVVASAKDGKMVFNVK